MFWYLGVINRAPPPSAPQPMAESSTDEHELPQPPASEVSSFSDDEDTPVQQLLQQQHELPPPVIAVTPVVSVPLAPSVEVPHPSSARPRLSPVKSATHATPQRSKSSSGFEVITPRRVSPNASPSSTDNAAWFAGSADGPSSPSAGRRINGRR